MGEQGHVYTVDEGLARVGFGKYQCFVLAYAGLGWVAEAMEIMILSFVRPTVKSEWDLSSTEESLITTVVFARLVVRAYTWGLVTDNYGRRLLSSFSPSFKQMLVTAGAGLLSSFSPNYITLTILRCLVGVGVGGGHVFLSWFLEFVPPSNRGMWMVIFSSFWTIGAISEAIGAWMGDERPVYTLDEALSALRFGKYQALVLAYAGLGWVADAMELMILSFVGPAVKSKWKLTSSEESLLTTVVFAGGLLGAYSWGIISDNYGRRKSFLSIATVTSVAGLLSTFSPNYVSLVIFRCLVGFGLGGGPVFLSYFLEFVPVLHRGTWMVVFSAFWTAGTIFEASLAWVVMTKLNWRWLLAFSAVPSFALLLFYGIAPESPRYLCAKGRTVDAHRILEKMAFVNGTKLPPGILVSDKEIKENEESSSLGDTHMLSMTRKINEKLKSGFSSFFMLFSRKLIRTTLLLWVLFFANAFSYYGAILLTSKLSSGDSKCGSKVLHADKSKDNSLYVDVFATSFAELPGLIFTAIIVDKIGRKLSMVLMFVLACIFLLPLVFHQSAVVTTVLLFGVRMCSTGSITVATIYAPEMYPTSTRTTGAGVASAVGRIGGMVCPLVAVGLVTSCHLRLAVILFEVVFVLAIASSPLFPFDTKGRELKDTVDAIES